MDVFTILQVIFFEGSLFFSESRDTPSF